MKRLLYKTLLAWKKNPNRKPLILNGARQVGKTWLLQNFAPPHSLIFDPMMGSQSSRIAAYKMGYDFVGCELDKDYFDKGCERFNRECMGEFVNKNGTIVKQLSLF